MTILGTGFDLIELSRIEQARRRFGARFSTRCFTPEEIVYCESFRDPAPHFAARFAAKEALAKALGTGVAEGVTWTQIEVRRCANGRPELLLHDAAQAHARRLGVQRVHLSLTHARELAGAFVILES